MTAGDVPALTDMTVREMIDATPLGPILDRPVGEVLAGLGLPPLPVLPALPPLPGLPPLPTLDLHLLIKPMTDLLGGFGTGNLSGAPFDPSAVFASLSKVLETSMSMGSQALKALDKVWTGSASTAAVGKSAQTSADAGRVATQGSGISMNIQAAAGIVAAGLATLQGIIAATVTKLVAAAPLLAAPGGAMVLVGFAGEGLSEAVAAVAATRAQLLGPTVTMAATGAPVPVTNAPVPSAAGPSPFALAGTVLDAVTPMVSTMAQLPSAIAAPVGKMLAAAQPHGPLPAATTTPSSHPRNGPAGGAPTGGGMRVRPAGAGGVGAVPGGLPAGMSMPLTSRLSAPAGLTEPASSGPQQPARTVTTTPGAVTPAMSPMGLAGTARGAGASNESHGLPDYLVTEHNGRQVVGEDAQVAPAVLGDDGGTERPPSITADIELRLGPVTGIERNEEP